MLLKRQMHIIMNTMGFGVYARSSPLNPGNINKFGPVIQPGGSVTRVTGQDNTYVLSVYDNFEKRKHTFMLSVQCAALMHGIDKNERNYIFMGGVVNFKEC